MILILWSALSFSPLWFCSYVSKHIEVATRDRIGKADIDIIGLLLTAQQCVKRKQQQIIKSINKFKNKNAWEKAHRQC